MFWLAGQVHAIGAPPIRDASITSSQRRSSAVGKKEQPDALSYLILPIAIWIKLKLRTLCKTHRPPRLLLLRALHHH